MLEALPTTLGAAACLPTVLFLWLVVTVDQRENAPIMVLSAFVLGAASIYLLPYARIPFEFTAGTSSDPVVAIILRALFRTAMPEETVKILVIAGFALRRRDRELPMDGLVVGAAVGLGFAAYENLAYLLHHFDFWQTLAVIRGVLTVPFHAALGMIAGAYIAGARYGGALGAHRHGRKTAVRVAVSAWLIPVVLHAMFDAPLLAIREGIDHGNLVQFLLWASPFVIGFGTIAFAVRLRWRVAEHERFIKMRPPARDWRAIWGVLILGGGAGFVGAAMIATGGILGFHVWASTSMAVGFILILLSLLSFYWGRRHLLNQTRPIP